jgi:nicotinamidase-related amidase
MATALLLIDIQTGMLGFSPPPHRGEETVGRIARLLERARARGVPVFHVQHDGGDGHPLAKGSPGWPLHAAVAPRAGETVIEKRHCSAFHDTDLHEQLARAGVDRLVVAGLQTENCVDSACRAAVALGYRVTLAQDGHTTFDTAVLPAALIIAHHNLTLGQSFVDLAASEEIAF